MAKNLADKGWVKTTSNHHINLGAKMTLTLVNEKELSCYAFKLDNLASEDARTTRVLRFPNHQFRCLTA